MTKTQLHGSQNLAIDTNGLLFRQEEEKDIEWSEQTKPQNKKTPKQSLTSQQYLLIMFWGYWTKVYAMEKQEWTKH